MNHPTHDRIEQIHLLLQQQGHRLTQARQLIVQVLIHSGAHLSADKLAEMVHEIDPHVGRMTVYRTLELLVELGVARPVYQGTGAAHYILIDKGHHHHLVCSNCEKVVEFEECTLEALQNLVSHRFNFLIQSHLIEFYGLCADCQTPPLLKHSQAI